MLSSQNSIKSIKKLSTRNYRRRSSLKGKKLDRTTIQDSGATDLYGTNAKVKDLNEVLNKELNAELKRKQEALAEEENRYKRVLVRRTEKERIVCLAADGSETSKQAFEIFTKEFLLHIDNSMLILPYIYNELKDSKYNWRYQKRNVLEYFQAAINASKLKKDEFFIMQERNIQVPQEIEQIYNIAEKNSAEYFAVGYNGLKGPTLLPANIQKGLHFLLSESKMPTFLMKDKLLRGEKNEGYDWLFVMDRVDSEADCLLPFDYFLPFMDTKRDCVHGLTLLPQIVGKDDMEQKFFEKMKNAGFNVEEQIGYEIHNYMNNQAEYLAEYVNHSTLMYFDFIIFYNNPSRYSIQKSNSEVFKMLERVNANMCWVNGYIDKYRPKNIEVAK
jgi:hypothetical protein